MQPKKDETVKVATKQENIYNTSEHPTNSVCDQPAGPYENPTNSYENLLTENDHVRDASKVKKTSTSSLSLMHCKESSTKYERLSTVDEPGDDP